MSIRLRLSLMYTAILTLTLALFGGVLYLSQAQFTLNWLKQDIEISSESLSQSIVQNYIGPRPPGANQQAPLPPPTSLSLSNNQAFQRQSEREIVRILDLNGNQIANPLGGSDLHLPISGDGIQAVRNQQNLWQTSDVAGTQILIFSRPVMFEGRMICILQIARSLTERNHMLQSLGSTLVITMVIAVLSAFGIGWVLAGMTLQPIAHLSQAAQEIGRKRDFSRRVNFNGPRDEIGQLASTLNSMLAQLQDAYQKVAEALEQQRRFVADVSHELRTPLTTIRGNLGLLMRMPPLPVEDQADVLNDMVEENDRLIRLVNDLLVMARANAGRNLTVSPVALRPLLEEVQRQGRQLDPGRKIVLEIAQDLTVIADRDAMKQVLLIVLDNALKYSDGEIHLSAVAEHAQAVLQVSDQGSGIPPEQLAHVFDRFFRGSEQRGTSGLGLGLPIAKTLVEGQGGSIVIQSAVGKGSRVILRFPLK